jgi:hypothetical protein
MRKLFYYLLKKYSNTEKDRLKILSKLDDEIHNDYYEQTNPGNVYNFFIEFIMSNYYIRTSLRKGDMKTLEMIKDGINDSFDEAIEWLKKDEFIINLNTFSVNEKTYNKTLDVLRILPTNYKNKIIIFEETFNGQVVIAWKHNENRFSINIENNHCSYYYNIDDNSFMFENVKIDKEIVSNLKNFYNKNRYNKLKNIINE